MHAKSASALSESRLVSTFLSAPTPASISTRSSPSHAATMGGKRCRTSWVGDGCRIQRALLPEQCWASWVTRCCLLSSMCGAAARLTTPPVPCKVCRAFVPAPGRAQGVALDPCLSPVLAGWGYRCESQVAGLGADTNLLHFVRQHCMGKVAFPLSVAHGAALTFTAEAGLLLPWGRRSWAAATCISDRFFLGGLSGGALRGFAQKGVGPSEARRLQNEVSDGCDGRCAVVWPPARTWAKAGRRLTLQSRTAPAVMVCLGCTHVRLHAAVAPCRRTAAAGSLRRHPCTVMPWEATSTSQ